MSSFWATLPPEVVYVPCAPVTPGDEQVQVALRAALGADGTTTLVLPAYSSTQELVRACGDDQPWVALRSDAVEGLLDDLGAQSVTLDVAFTAPQPPG